MSPSASTIVSSTSLDRKVTVSWQVSCSLHSFARDRAAAAGDETLETEAEGVDEGEVDGVDDGKEDVEVDGVDDGEETEGEENPETARGKQSATVLSGPGT